MRHGIKRWVTRYVVHPVPVSILWEHFLPARREQDDR